MNLPAPAHGSEDGETDFATPWTIGDTFKGIALLLATNLAASLVIIGAERYFGLNHYFVLMALVIATITATLFTVWFFTARKYQAPWQTLGFKAVSWRTAAVVLPAEIGVLILENLYAQLLAYFGVTKIPEQPVFQIIGHSRAALILALLVAGIVAPVSEEIFFRGFVYTAWRRRHGVAFAVIGSSLIFALMHMLPLLIVPIFIIGAALAILYEYRGSLIPPIILHALNNIIALLYLYLR